ncbi:hypothetical protein QUF72_15390 [Desulfobacterales bacterium HSG2]|nr:hypothetical protein [Desulfobacterales bacterium HSG2]
MSGLNKEFTWFFVIFSREFRQDKRIAFETLMFLAIAHFFGFYNPKQLADFLGIPHQGLYRAIEGGASIISEKCSSVSW